MAISHVGSSVVSNTVATTTHAISRPGSTLADDVGYVIVTIGVAAGTTPTGWTLVKSETGGGNAQVYLYRRVFDASATDDFSLSTGTTSTSGLDMSVYRGVDTGTPEDVTATSAFEGLSVGLDAILTGVTIVTSGAWLLACWGLNSGSTTITPPGDLTERQEAAGKHTSLADSNTGLATGATGDKTATLSAEREWAGILTAIRPSGGAAAVAALVPRVSVEPQSRFGPF